MAETPSPKPNEVSKPNGVSKPNEASSGSLNLLEEVDSLKARAAVFRPKAVKRFTSPEDLDDLMVVTQPQSWLLMLAAALVIGAAGVWAVFGSIVATASGVGMLVEPVLAEPVLAGPVLVEPVLAGPVLVEPAPNASGEVSAEVDDLHAVLWVPIAEAHRMEPGMKVRLSPRGFPVARYGYLEGVSREVDRVPRWVAGEFDLEAKPWLESLKTGTYVRVEVDLLKDPDSADGRRWTTQHESPVHLVSGLTVDAVVFLGSEQPLPYFLPWLR